MSCCGSSSGVVLSAQTWNFAPVITEPSWALGFEMLGLQYDQLKLNQRDEYFQGVQAPSTPPAINAQQALFFTSLRTYNCTSLNSTTAQFTDAYATPTGIVQTKFTAQFDLVGKKVTVSNLMTKLPQSGSFRACNEILTSAFRAFVLQFQQAPSQVDIPYTL